MRLLRVEFPGNAVTGLLPEEKNVWDRFADLPEADGACQLCYTGATEAQVLAGKMQLQHHELEVKLDTELAVQGIIGETVIAWALLQPGS